MSTNSVIKHKERQLEYRSVKAQITDLLLNGNVENGPIIIMALNELHKPANSLIAIIESIFLQKREIFERDAMYRYAIYNNCQILMNALLPKVIAVTKNRGSNERLLNEYNYTKGFEISLENNLHVLRELPVSTLGVLLWRYLDSSDLLNDDELNTLHCTIRKKIITQTLYGIITDELHVYKLRGATAHLDFPYAEIQINKLLRNPTIGCESNIYEYDPAGTILMMLTDSRF